MAQYKVGSTNLFIHCITIDYFLLIFMTLLIGILVLIIHILFLKQYLQPIL